MLKLNLNQNADNPIWKHELVTITIPANQTPNRINFPDVQNLRDVHLSRIEIYSDKILPKNITGNAVVTETEIQKCFLTMQLYNGVEFAHQIPIQRFYNWQTAGAFQKLPNFIGQKVNYPKSYIEFVGLTSAAFDRDFVFCIYYAAPLEREKNDMKYEFKKKMQ